MEEMKKNMVNEDALEAVSGGVTAKPAQRFEEGDLVKVSGVGSSKDKYNYGRVGDCEYDDSLGVWTYQVEFGRYRGATWIPSGCSDTYYPQPRLSPWTSIPSEIAP